MTSRRKASTTQRFPATGPCPRPDKERCTTMHWAMIAAKQIARRYVADGRHFDPLYGYPCVCGYWHMTRRPSWNDQDNALLWQVPDALQEWAKRPAPPA